MSDVPAGAAGNDAAATPSPPWTRLVGGLVDFVVIAVVVEAVASAWTTAQHENGGAVVRPTTAAYALALMLRALYHVVGVGAFGTTIGKRLMGLRVVRATDGGRLGWARALVRFLVADLGWMVAWFAPRSWGGAANIGWVVLNVAVYLPIVLDPRSRGLHDRLSGAVVVRS